MDMLYYLLKNNKTLKLSSEPAPLTHPNIGDMRNADG